MIRFLLSSLLLVSFQTMAQKNAVTKVKIKISDSRKITSYSSYKPDIIQFFKQPENKEVKLVHRDGMRDTPIEVDSMPVGKYTIRYKNVWQQDVDTQIVLTNKPVNAIQLFIDRLLNYPANTLALLQEKDSIVITDHAMGCFANTKEKIVIVKQNGKLFASYYTGKKELLPGKEMVWVERDILKKAILTNENIWDFIRFENELNYLRERDNCTTSEAYEVSSKYWNVKKVDGSCDWWGLDQLRKKLFKEN